MKNLFTGGISGVHGIAGPFYAPSAFNAPLMPESGANPDDSQGDDSQSSDDDADTGESTPPAERSGDHAEPEEADEDLLTDDDSDENDQDPREAAKKLRAKNRKLRRRMARHLPALNRIKGLDLDDLIARARRGDEFAETVRNNPKLRRLLAANDDEDEPTPRARRGADPEPADDEFDESQLPFDPNTDATHRFFADMAKRNHSLERTVKQLQGRLDAGDQKEVQRTEAAITREWKSTIDAAAEEISDPLTKKLFKDAMAGAYMSRAKHKRSPQDLVRHYLADTGVSKGDAKRANDAAAAAAKKPNGAIADAAARQRIATNNQTTSRNVAPTGNPAPARTGKERLADVRRRLATIGRG